MLITRVTGDGEPVSVIAAILALNTVLLTPVALPVLPNRMPDLTVSASIAALGLSCTAAAVMAYVALISEVGPSRGTVVFFVTPLVTVTAGAVVLDKAVTAGTLLGLLLIVVGSGLATGRISGAEPARARPDR